VVPVLPPLDEQRHFLCGTGHQAIVRHMHRFLIKAFLSKEP
jgi:hypothetical protein